MMRTDVPKSPQAYARTGGILYAFIILAALFGEVRVRGRLLVSGNAAATAANILGSETLFRAGIAAEMLTCVCDVALAAILYILLKAIDPTLALLAAFFRLTFVSLYAVAKLFEIVTLLLLKGGNVVKVIQLKQLQSMAYLSLGVHAYGYGASLLFFGFSTLLFGYLIYRSGYLPRLIGILLVIAGVGYAAYSLAQMLSPAITEKLLFPWLLLPGFFAELGLCLWLILRGVDARKWEQTIQS